VGFSRKGFVLYSSVEIETCLVTRTTMDLLSITLGSHPPNLEPSTKKMIWKVFQGCVPVTDYYVAYDQNKNNVGFSLDEVEEEEEENKEDIIVLLLRMVVIMVVIIVTLVMAHKKAMDQAADIEANEVDTGKIVVDMVISKVDMGKIVDHMIIVADMVAVVDMMPVAVAAVMEEVEVDIEIVSIRGVHVDCKEADQDRRMVHEEPQEEEETEVDLDEVEEEDEEDKEDIIVLLLRMVVIMVVIIVTLVMAHKTAMDQAADMEANEVDTGKMVLDMVTSKVDMGKIVDHMVIVADMVAVVDMMPSGSSDGYGRGRGGYRNSFGDDSTCNFPIHSREAKILRNHGTKGCIRR